ncbi:MAG: hypothetical protein AAFU71_00180 [Cyanobacteria bacterium J06632_22]
MANLTTQQFVGPVTGIAIAIPPNWQSKILRPSPEAPTELYQCPPAKQHSPQIVVQVIPIPVEEYYEGSYRDLAAELILEQQEASLNGSIREIDQREVTIDGYAARVDVFSYIDPDSDTSIIQYQVCVQMASAVGAIVGSVTTAEMMQYLPIFEAAENSLDLSHYINKSEK